MSKNEKQLSEIIDTFEAYLDGVSDGTVPDVNMMWNIRYFLADIRKGIAALVAERDLLRTELELNQATLFALALEDETGGHKPTPTQHQRIAHRMYNMLARMSILLGIDLATLAKITERATSLKIKEKDEHDG